jgi:hypothetical protein
MGLADALRARWALARDESFGEAVRIMFASREERRRIAARKFPGRTVRKAQRQASDAFAGLLDAGWYAGAHGVRREEAEAHFRTRGLAGGLAPQEALAGVDGRHLSGRGAEFLLRLGLPLGVVAGEHAAEGLDPWAIGNPARRSLAVVTAIAAPGERLLPVPPDWASGADFYVVSAFTLADCGVWRIVRPVFHHPDPARVTAFTRTHLHTFFGAYARVLWLDPGVICCTDPAALAEGAPLAVFRKDGRTLAAELAAQGAEAADVIGRLADHPAFNSTDVYDPTVLLADPADAGVADFMARWWRHALRGPAAGGSAFTIAAAEMPGLSPGELPGRVIEGSPDFVQAPA